MSVAAAPFPAANLQTFLAFDFGVKRTGVATGNVLTRTASPQATIAAVGDARFSTLLRVQRNTTLALSNTIRTPCLATAQKCLQLDLRFLPRQPYSMRL